MRVLENMQIYQLIKLRIKIVENKRNHVVLTEVLSQLFTDEKLIEEIASLETSQLYHNLHNFIQIRLSNLLLIDTLTKSMSNLL